MTVINSREFLENPIYYFYLALKEEVAVKRGKTTFQILPKPTKAKNDIDPDDPFWDDPKNVEAVEKAIDRYKSGEMKFTRLTPEIEKKWFGNL